MAVLDWITEPSLVLEGERVRLRPPRASDYKAWAELRAASRAFLQPWEPTWPQDDLTRAAFRRRLSIYGRDHELGHGYALFLIRKEDDKLLGGINLRDIRRGVAQMAAFGYWIGQPYAGQGYMGDALRTACAFGFQTLGLHRLEAACLPENQPSRQLLLRAGFEQEGFARGYLKINGVWRDHLLFGLVRDGPG
jgi:ribosomal-protein-alanine N-acetyltransferase